MLSCPGWRQSEWHRWHPHRQLLMAAAPTPGLYPRRTISGKAIFVKTVAFTMVDPETAPNAAEAAVVTKRRLPLNRASYLLSEL